MSNIKEQKKLRFNFFTKLFLFFILLSLFIFSVTIITTQYYITLLKKKIEEKYITSLTLIRNVINEQLFNANRTVLAYCWTRNFIRIRRTYNPRINYPYGYSFSNIKFLKEHNVNTLIHNIYYIHSRSNSVIGDSVSLKENDFFSIYYPELDRSKLNYYFEDLNNILPKKTKLRYKKDYINVIPILIKDQVDKRNKILININEKRLNDIIRKYLPEPESAVMVMDSEGFIRATTIEEENLQETILADKNFLRLINLKTSFSYKLLSEKIFVIKTRSIRSAPNLNLYYLLIIPYNTLYKESTLIRNISLIISLSTLLFALLLSFFMSRYLYNPIKNIISLFQNKDTKINDEFSFISQNVHKLLKDKEKLAKEISKDLPIVYENYLYKLLKSKTGFKESDLITTFNKKNIIFKYPNFVVTITRIIFSSDFYETFNREDQLKILNQIYKLTKNAFPSSYNIYILTITNNELCVILNIPDSDNVEILKVINRIHKVYDIKQYYLNIYSGIGKIHFGFKGLKNSFDEAYKALSSITPISDSQIKVFDAENTESSQNTATLNELNQFNNLLFSGNSDKCLKKLNSIINKMQVKYIPKKNQKKLLVKIYDYCNKLMINYSIDEKEIMNKDFIDIKNNYKNYHVKNISKYFIKLIPVITSFIPKDYKRKINLTEIIDYINKNFASDISLEMIADDYNVSRHYLSKSLKKSLNMTFQQYLNNLRIKKAKFLLLNTKKNINDIFTECGYNSRYTLIRMFKKHEGLTPSEFRYIDNHKKFLNIDKKIELTS